MTNTLFDGLFADVKPERAFAEIPGEGDAPSRWYTYAHIEQVTARFAATLAARGVKPGDRVAAQIPKSIEALMLYLATVRAGAIFLPLNTAYTAAEVDYFIGDAEPKLFLCDPKSLDGYIGIAEKYRVHLDSFGVWRSPEVSAGTFFDFAEAQTGTFDTVPRAPEDLAAILYTSGTTGRSKGAMLSHKNLLSNAETLAEEWRFTEDDVLLHALPIYHTHGLFVASNTVMKTGGQMIFMSKFDADAVVKNLPNATSMMGVPTFYTRLLAHYGFTKQVTEHMRLFTSGSAPLLAETHREFEARTGHRILERYGMTETNMNTSNPYDGERRAGTVGFPLPGVELRIVDENAQPVTKGEIGTIEVRGDNVCQGYWRMPEKTKEEMREDGFFITGDLGMEDEDGYVVVVGRGKDLIITGGFNVYPKEIESVIDDLPGVTESAVIGAPHPDFGEGVVAVVVGEGDEDAILSALADKLAKFKQPKRVFFVDALPRNTMGKVQKNILRDSYKRLFVR